VQQAGSGLLPHDPSALVSPPAATPPRVPPLAGPIHESLFCLHGSPGLTHGSLSRLESCFPPRPLSRAPPKGPSTTTDVDVIAAFTSCDPRSSPSPLPRPSCKRELHEPFLHLIYVSVPPAQDLNSRPRANWTVATATSVPLLACLSTPKNVQVANHATRPLHLDNSI
jgi:hypothetical protein